MRVLMRSMLVAVIYSALLFAGTDSTRFGEATIQFEQQPSTKLLVHNAILYRSVAIDYDTTLQLKDRHSTRRFYYPQLHKGDRYVLHLLLGSDSLGRSKNASFYDTYVDLGDTLMDTIRFVNKEASIFLSKQGQVSGTRAYSSAENGAFYLKQSELQNGVNGSFDVSFSLPGTAVDAPTVGVRLTGDLKVPEENLRQGEALSISGKGQKKEQHRQNLFIALIASAFLVMIALR